MLASIDYTCGLCGKPGQAQYKPEMVHKLERWVSILHCNRCADFKVMLRKLRDNCKRLVILRWQLQKAGKMKQDQEALVRKEIEDLTKAIAQLVCVHWRVGVVWEPDFVNQLLDFPDKAEFIVNQYAHLIQTQAQSMHEQARMAV